MVVLQLEMDQIDPSLMDTDHHHRQFQLQRTTTANDHQDAMDVQDGQGADSRHFGRLLDAIHIGSNDGSSSTSNAAHGEQWQHSDRPPHKQRPHKRKRSHSDAGEPATLTKLRRTIQEQVISRDVATQGKHMTTITVYHASAAQKSYGQEKRFLCPPPLVRASGPLLAHIRQQVFKMAVLSETGATLQEQVSAFDSENGIVCFKHLHITSQGKDKQFQLALNIAENSGLNGADPTSPHPDTPISQTKGLHVNSSPSGGGEPWATLQSSPVHIISKPSKKTTRGNTPGISNLGSIALFNRINSQTVRTKYLSHRRDNVLTTSSAHWAPFTVKMVPEEPVGAPVVYGSRIVLTAPAGPDGTGGFQSHEYIIRKVEKHRSLSTDYGRPVSQMQKIALLRVDVAPVEGKVCYLSALVERPGDEPITVVPGSTHATSWRLCEVKQDVDAETGGVSGEWHEVNDYATWMITSIDQFQCTFFDATGGDACPPRARITPAPSVVQPIRWAMSGRRNEHHLEISTVGFFSTTASGAKEPLQVWLGDMGPLRLISNDGAATPPVPSGSKAPIVPLTTTTQDFVVTVTSLSNPSTSTNNGPNLRDPPVTTFIAVELPSMPDILRALLESVRGRRITSSVNGGPEPPPNLGHGRNGGTIHEDEGTETDEELWMKDPALPLLFVRGSDGIGFHSGYALRCVPVTGPGALHIDGLSVWVSKVENLDHTSNA